MNVAQELERLAKLRAAGSLTTEEFAQAKGRILSDQELPLRGIRRQSSRKLWGLPLWAIAVGPDWKQGEMRGHARAIFALGDMATGYFACGGLARGIVAVGGLAVGPIAFGGAAVGFLAIGGAALGWLALGGAAIGAVAVGAAACGYYAFGAAAAGVHTLSELHRDPAAVDFIQRYVPWLTLLLHP